MMSSVVTNFVLSLPTWCLWWDLGLNCVSSFMRVFLLFVLKNVLESVIPGCMLSILIETGDRYVLPVEMAKLLFCRPDNPL